MELLKEAMYTKSTTNYQLAMHNMSQMFPIIHARIMQYDPKHFALSQKRTACYARMTSSGTQACTNKDRIESTIVSPRLRIALIRATTFIDTACFPHINTYHH